MYYIKINLCVSLTQVGNGVNTEISRDSKATKERPTGAFALIHTVQLADSAVSEKLQPEVIAGKEKALFLDAPFPFSSQAIPGKPTRPTSLFLICVS